MKPNHGPTPLADDRGISIIEVLLALLIFTLAILGLASTGFLASQELRRGRSYQTEWTAAQRILDSLTAVGRAGGLTGTETGVDTIGGYQVSFEVQGTAPSTIFVVVERKVLLQTSPDTFVTRVQ